MLFREAQELAVARDYDRACPKFAESRRLDPTAGGGLTLADCHEKQGKLASAWGSFKAAEFFSRDAGDKPREAEAARRAAALTPRLAKPAFTVPPATRVPGFELRRDGSLVGEGQFGSALPIDVGSHSIEASAPGRKPWSTVVRIEVDGTSASIQIEPLERLEVSPAATKEQVPRWGAQRIAGVAGLAADGAGIVVGSILGGLAAKKLRDPKSTGRCDPDWATCDATGMQMRDDA